MEEGTGMKDDDAYIQNLTVRLQNVRMSKLTDRELLLQEQRVLAAIVAGEEEIANPDNPFITLDEALASIERETQFRGMNEA